MHIAGRGGHRDRCTGHMVAAERTERENVLVGNRAALNGFGTQQSQCLRHNSVSYLTKLLSEDRRWWQLLKWPPGLQTLVAFSEATPRVTLVTAVTNVFIWARRSPRPTRFSVTCCGASRFEHSGALRRLITLWPASSRSVSSYYRPRINAAFTSASQKPAEHRTAFIPTGLHHRTRDIREKHHLVAYPTSTLRGNSRRHRTTCTQWIILSHHESFLVWLTDHHLNLYFVVTKLSNEKTEVRIKTLFDIVQKLSQISSQLGHGCIIYFLGLFILPPTRSHEKMKMKCWRERKTDVCLRLRMRSSLPLPKFPAETKCHQSPDAGFVVSGSCSCLDWNESFGCFLSSRGFWWQICWMDFTEVCSGIQNILREPNDSLSLFSVVTHVNTHVMDQSKYWVFVFSFL